MTTREPFEAPVPGGSLVGSVVGDGASVLALHGGPGLSNYLDEMVAELATSYRVATYQQRGLTPSILEGPFSVDQEVADVTAVLDALGWPRAWVVGHSWGGHLVLHLAVEAPDRLSGGLAVDPLGGTGDGGLAEMSRRFDLWMQAHPTDEPEGEDLGLARVWAAYFAVPDLAPPMPAIRGNRDANEGIFASLTEALPSLTERLGSIEVPMGFVAGAASPLSPELSSIPTSGAIPGSWVEVIEGAGHFPWVERPGCVRRGLDRLVNTATPSP